MIAQRTGFFTCDGCESLYHVVKVRSTPEQSRKKVACVVCGAPFARRDVEFVVKYFVVRRTDRSQKQRRAYPLRGRGRKAAVNQAQSDGPAEVARLALQARPIGVLGEGQEPEGTSGHTGGGGRLGLS